ncbi:glycosyltransferase family 87 protein [Arthrobacter bambusae]|uniref:glycosyltransferase family 87 protein n=1 Tax=Arthrobacter bambusae TaxID=1338426 RepID=UPI00277D3BE1|nr:glycosyltransferase 87 family protein [Arthrobacter bambusae]MDQ0029827.1 putative membrane protein [Arthrobacter bambusae]MDQ0097655.1 putative membrane protein [Arthrobacter bambusae]
MQETEPHIQQKRARFVVPSRSDSLLGNFTELIGGPLGRRSSPGSISPGFFTVERVLIILTIAAAITSILIKGYCRVNGWHTPEQFYATCYSDFPELFNSRGLADGVFPLFDQKALFEYPVITGLIAGVTAWLVPGHGASPERTLGYFDVNAALIAAMWIVVVLATARINRHRPWDAAMVAVAPGMVLAGVINWDMWAVAMLAVGMYFFAKERPVIAGLFIGLGTATKLYPALILGALFLLAVRSGRPRAFFVTTLSAAGAWLAVNAPIAVVNPAGWRYFFDFTQDRPAGYSSLWFAYNLVAERLQLVQLSPGAINALAMDMLLLACVVIAALALTAPRRPRLAQLTFLIVAAFILSNKVYSPQYVLWLVPLLALARPRWRDFLLWQAAEALHWAATWMYLAQISSGGAAQNNIDMPYYVMAVMLHMVATAYLMVRVAWDIWEPQLDPLRVQGVDDPHGGVFNGAKDWFRVDLKRPAASVLPWRRRPLKSLEERSGLGFQDGGGTSETSHDSVSSSHGEAERDG